MADPTPTAPAPGDSFKEGGSCHIAWEPDTSGVWKVMDIQLMTGSNFNMVNLTTVTTVDGTNTATTTYDYPCPEVSPNSAIYFYQFSSPASKTLYWTTRFTITDENGNSTPPSNPTQPGTNAPIPWGTGALVGGAGNSTVSASSAPPVATPNSTVSSVTPQASSFVTSVVQTPSDTPSPSSTAQGNVSGNGATGVTVNRGMYTAIAFFFAVGCLFGGLL